MDPTNVNAGSLRRNVTRRVNRVFRMPTITDYIIIEARYARDVVRDVMNKAKEGYVPQGGITVLTAGQSGLYSQAMVKQ